MVHNFISGGEIIMQTGLNFRQLEQERVERLRAYFMALMESVGGLCSCFDNPFLNQTHVPTEETFELVERGLEFLNQAVATLKEKPVLRAL